MWFWKMSDDVYQRDQFWGSQNALHLGVMAHLHDNEALATNQR
jgi:hypothetical protein